MSKKIIFLVLVLVGILFVSCEKKQEKSDQDLLKMAMDQKDQNLCAEIKSPTGKYGRNNCYAYFAAVSNDISLCEKVSINVGYGSKERCRQLVVANK